MITILISPLILVPPYETDLCKIIYGEENIETPLISYVTNSIEPEISREDFSLLYEMGWPVSDPIISSGYGSRESCDACSTFHQAIDFTPGIGKPVMAAMRGTIVEIEDSGQYGFYIIIEHDLHNEIWHTVYAHLQRGSAPREIHVGKSVEIGDVIGAVGRTGLATGPHLHFEIRIDDVKVNPLPLLKKYISQDN